MKTYAVITSMSDAYYQQIGRACIESFGAHWPKEIPLYVFDENIVDPPKRKWTTYVPWSDLGHDLKNFCRRNEIGRVQTFAKKAFSVIAGLKMFDVDRLIWLDADVISTSDINTQLLDLITPDHVLSTHYGVKHNWPTEQEPDRMCFSCETGFFAVNRRHPQFQQFLNRYQEYYLKDLGRLLRRFYDGDVYGAVVQEFENAGTKMFELNPEQRHRTPIPRSVLAPYIHHYKAGAKEPWNSQQLLKKHNIAYENSSLSPVNPK